MLAKGNLQANEAQKALVKKLMALQGRIDAQGDVPAPAAPADFSRTSLGGRSAAGAAPAASGSFFGRLGGLFGGGAVSDTVAKDSGGADGTGGALSVSPAIKGLYIWGGVGQGKTMIMDRWVGQILINKTQKHQGERATLSSVPSFSLLPPCVNAYVSAGRSLHDWLIHTYSFYDTTHLSSKKRVHFHQFMLDVHARLHKKKAQNKAEGRADADPLIQVAYDIRREAQLLCFDEFHVVHITDAMILKRLFEGLFQVGRCRHWLPGCVSSGE